MYMLFLNDNETPTRDHKLGHAWTSRGEQERGKGPRKGRDGGGRKIGVSPFPVLRLDRIVCAPGANRQLKNAMSKRLKKFNGPEDESQRKSR